jgi:DNA-binding NarL/FixJ family response regulator
MVSTEASQAAAAAIPGARLAIVDGHAMPGDVDQTLDVIDRFLGDLLTHSSEVESMQPPSVNLSGREVEVLRLIAAGRSNAQIADELVISQNTVIRHVSNIFGKIGAANRAEATSYAHRQGLV